MPTRRPLLVVVMGVALLAVAEPGDRGVVPRADCAQARAHAVAPVGVDGDDQEAAKRKSFLRRTGLSLEYTIRLMASWQDDRWLSENRNSLLLHCLPVGRHPSKRNRQINIGFFYWVHHRLGSEAASKSAHWDQSYYRQMSLYMYTMVYREVVHKQIVQKFSNF